jgi:hypothetical protein
MGQFRRFLNEAALKELHLEGRLFTWSNERAHPTLEKIDRVFVSSEWEGLYPGYDLCSLASLCFDHAPLLLRTNRNFFAKKRFLFRSFWTKFPGFLEVIKKAWHCPLQEASPILLFRNTTRFLKSWSDRVVGNVRLQIELAKEVAHRLEVARDRRQLATHEEGLRKFLKLKSLALASLQRTIARQESRILWLSEGDASTKFFHIHASARRRRNFIRTLEVGEQVLVDEGRKAEAVYSFFDAVLGTTPLRANSINLELLDLPSLDLHGLGNRFTEEEVLHVIRSLRPDKAPRPRWIHGQVAWEIIRPDLMRAFEAFWHMDIRDLHLSNEALMILTPQIN